MAGERLAGWTTDNLLRVHKRNQQHVRRMSAVPFKAEISWLGLTRPLRADFVAEGGDHRGEAAEAISWSRPLSPAPLGAAALTQWH
jgi:hypothetical protein